MPRASTVAFSILCGPAICLYISFAACFCPGRFRHRRNDEEKKRFERRQMVAPRPLGAVRPRRLTLPLCDPPEILNEKEQCEDGIDKDAVVIQEKQSSKQTTLDQSQSNLMRLPLELRRMIYKYAVGNNTLHLVLKEHKLGHVRCEQKQKQGQGQGDQLGCPLGFNGLTLARECCWGTVDSANIWAPTSGSKQHTDGDILPLLVSCRQIYSEAIDFLYTTNIFSISDLDALRYLSSTTLQSRFSRIQYLSIEWVHAWPIYDSIAQHLLLSDPALYPPYDECTWEDTWRIIAGMKNLKELRVSLLYFDGFRDRASEKKMLGPLMNVKGVGKFDVYVSWDGEVMPEAPFRLVRPSYDRVEEESL